MHAAKHALHQYVQDMQHVGYLFLFYFSLFILSMAWMIRELGLSFVLFGIAAGENLARNTLETEGEIRKNRDSDRATLTAA